MMETIRKLKLRFESIQEAASAEDWEKEMWEYFKGLYKNCNKGIKGRGKDRRIANTAMSPPRRPGMMGTGWRRDSHMSSSSSLSEQGEDDQMRIN